MGSARPALVVHLLPSTAMASAVDNRVQQCEAAQSRADKRLPAHAAAWFPYFAVAVLALQLATLLVLAFVGFSVARGRQG